jgi:hypothetical protein
MARNQEDVVFKMKEWRRKKTLPPLADKTMSPSGEANEGWNTGPGEASV